MIELDSSFGWCIWTGRGLPGQGRFYADDFVILSRKSAGEALAWTRQVMTKLDRPGARRARILEPDPVKNKVDLADSSSPGVARGAMRGRL